MKKWIIAGIITVLISGCSMETVTPDVKQEEPTVIEQKVEFEPRNVEASYINVESERLNVRKDADEASEKVGSLLKNDKLQVISEKLDAQKRIWYQVETGEGASGYVAGWFCAKTKITIRVEEDKATIVNVDVEPIPNYVENPFKVNKAAVGDQIVGLSIQEISQISELNKILFKGVVELTGTYYHEESSLSTGKSIRFVPDEASSVLLPRFTEDINSVWFLISNYDAVSSKFGEIGTTGYATVKVSNYTIGYGVKGAYNQATLENVTIE